MQPATAREAIIASEFLSRKTGKNHCMLLLSLSIFFHFLFSRKRDECSVTTTSFVAATQKDERTREWDERERNEKRREDVKGVSFRDRDREGEREKRENLCLCVGR